MAEADLKRILRLLREGRLTDEQAESMIRAIEKREPERAEERDGGPDGGGRRMRDSRGRASRRRARGRVHVDLDLNLGETVAGAIDSATSALKHAGRLGPVFWLNDTNVSTLSRLDDPDGESFECEDNNITVSSLREITLSASAFCDNEMNASAIRDLRAEKGEFRGNEMHGSSIKQLVLNAGLVSNCRLNGSQVSSSTVADGKLDDCTLNGSHLRDLDIDGGSLAESKFNGSKVSALTVSERAEVTGLNLNGVKCRDLAIVGGKISDLSISGLRMDGCEVKGCELAGVTFRNERWADYVAYDQQRFPRIRDLLLESVKAQDVKFIRCRFDGTVIRNCELEDMTFREVDFTGMTLESTEAMAKWAEPSGVELASD